MRIVVPIKQVPETSNVKMDPETGTMIRTGVEAIVNPLDLYAIETALRLREQLGGQIVALSMGPAKAARAVQEAIAMGCDEGVLLSHRKFAGSDTWATSYERDGYNQRGGTADLATNGVDDDGNGLVDDPIERDTVPPYGYPLRGLQVKIRVYEPGTRQMRQATIIADTDPDQAAQVLTSMLKNVDNYSVEILISLALAAGGYALADRIHMSGPIAMVVAGLLIGNHGRAFALSPKSCEHLDTFWELADEILNAVLFVLIGLEVIVLTFTGRFLLAGVLMIPAVLAARWISVGLPIGVARRWQTLHPQAQRILTWGGLRGGISVALALSIPTLARDGSPIPEREVLLAVTYLIVVFSIVVQGLTIGSVVKHALAGNAIPAGDIGDRDE